MSQRKNGQQQRHDASELRDQVKRTAPSYKAVVMQSRIARPSPSQQQPVALRVYRSQPVPRVLQTKNRIAPALAVNPTRRPVAPPVYRPQVRKIVQPKMASASQAMSSPKAPPVYHPQPTPKVLQTKQAQARPASGPGHLKVPQGQQLLARERTTSQHPGAGAKNPRTVPVHGQAMKTAATRIGQNTTMRLALQQPRMASHIIQRAKFPAVMSDKDIGAITDYNKKLEVTGQSESEQEQIARIKKETLALTSFSGAVEFNCYAWALGNNQFEDPGGKLSTWKHRLKSEYTFVSAAAQDAKILLWGNPIPDSEDFEVLHASVLLTHDELLARTKKDFSKINVDDKTVKTIQPNPFWSSALGFGYGIITHSRNFFQGGDFGNVIAGMKPK